MADLLAIISHDRAEQNAGVLLADLSASHEALRGPMAFAAEAGNGWAAVRVLDGAQPPQAGIEEQGKGWAAWAGPLAGAAASTPLGELDGQFALLRLDEDGETLELATDPLGLKPLFVAEAGGRTYAATSALVLARALRAAPSRLGLETFLRVGNQFGQLTPWEGIERLRPGEVIAFTPGGRSRRTYWQPRVDLDLRRLDLAQCAEACIERSAAAIAARYEGERPWMDLTGGFDTRILSLLTRRAGIEFFTNTSGEEGSDDVRLAREIAATAGWPWTHQTLPADWDRQLPDYVSQAVAWGDCHLDALPLAEVLLGHRDKAQERTLLLNGGGGEHFRDHPWGQELFAANRSRTVNFDRLLRWRLLGPLDLSIFREDPTPAVAARLRSELETRVEPFAETPNTFQCDLIYALKSTGHSGAYQSAAGAYVHMEVPIYLRGVFEAVISAPPRHRNYHRLQREMMRQLDPAIAAIQTETGGPAEPLRPGNLHRFAPYPWRRGRRFASRLQGRVFGAGDSRSAPSQIDTARAELLAGWRREGRFDPAAMRSGSLYEPAALERLLETAVAAPAEADWGTLGRVVTVELALGAVDAGLG